MQAHRCRCCRVGNGDRGSCFPVSITNLKESQMKPGQIRSICLNLADRIGEPQFKNSQPNDGSKRECIKVTLDRVVFYLCDCTMPNGVKQKRHLEVWTRALSGKPIAKVFNVDWEPFRFSTFRPGDWEQDLIKSENTVNLS